MSYKQINEVIVKYNPLHLYSQNEINYVVAVNPDSAKCKANKTASQVFVVWCWSVKTINCSSK